MRAALARLRRRPDGQLRALWKVGLSLFRLPGVIRAVPSARPRLPSGIASALFYWRWSTANHRARRRARRAILRSLRERGLSAAAAGLIFASIASPTGMGGDGRQMYDTGSRTWFGNLVGTLRASGSPWFDVTSPAFLGGAKGNGITDDTAAIKAAIASLPASGGVIFFPAGNYIVSSSLPIANNTLYLGASLSQFVSGAPAIQPTVVLSMAGAMSTPIFDATAAGTIYSPAWDGLAFTGNPGTSGTKGIHTGSAVNLAEPSLANLFFTSFGDQALHIEKGVGGSIFNVFIQGGCSVRTGRAAFLGALDVASNDMWFSHIFATCSNVVGDGVGSGFLCGMVIRGANCSLVNCYGELSQTGIYVSSTAFWNKFTNCRAMLNNGNGCQVDGSNNTFVNCVWGKNSQVTNNANDGMLVTGGYNDIIGCRAENNAGDVNKMRFGFTDNNPTVGQANRYLFNSAVATVSGIYNSIGAQLPVRLDADRLGKVWLGSDGGALTAAWWQLAGSTAVNDLARFTDLTNSRVYAFGPGTGGAGFGVSDATGGVVAWFYGTASKLTTMAGGLQLTAAIQPGTPAGATQAGQIFQGSGAPNNANGNNGDSYFRTDTPGTANQRLYVKSAGAWTGIL